MSDLQEYIKKYSIKHEISEQEAMNHALVREVAKYYDNPQAYRITKQKLVDICGIGKQEEMEHVEEEIKGIEEYGHTRGIGGC